MTNGDLPPSLVTVTGCGSAGARRLVGASSIWVRSLANAIDIDQGAVAGAKVAWYLKVILDGGERGAMPILTIKHITTYRYRHSVAFREHRMMQRPRDSHDQKLIDARLLINPTPAHILLAL